MNFLRTFLALLLLTATLFAQYPGQLGPIYLQATKYQDVLDASSANYRQTDMVSNGVGHHYITVRNNRVEYTQFDNSGNIVRSNSFVAGSGWPAITSYQGTLHVVLFDGSQLKIYRSTDEGTNWSLVNEQTAFGDRTDSYEDADRVYITCRSTSTGGAHFYALYKPFSTWENYPSIVPGSNFTNNASVIASAESAHVYTSNGLYSMPLSGQTTNWTGVQAHGNSGPSSIVKSIRAGEECFDVAPLFFVNPFGYFIQRYWRKAKNSTGWQMNSSIPGTHRSDWNVQSAFTGNTYWYVAFGVLANEPLYWRTETPPGTSSGTTEINGSDPYQSGSIPVMSANQSGIAVVWKNLANPNLGYAAFRHKPIAVSGTISEKSYFTDTTWIVGTTTVASGTELRLKSGSVTYLLGQWYIGVNDFGGPGKLILSSGSSLVIESGATLILKAPQPTQNHTDGGELHIPISSQLLVPAGAKIIAEQGAKFKFSPSSSMLSYGQIITSGTPTLPVSFASVYGGGGTWNGITLSGSGANGSTLQYATVANVLTYWGSALNVLDAKGVAISNCSISGNNSNGTNGLYLYNATDAMVGYNTINDNAGNGIRINETGYAYVYNNHIQNNSNAGVSIVHSTIAFGNPFSATGGRNTIIGGNYGVEAFWYSYPWMGSKGNPWVGSNSVCSNTSYRIYATDNSIVAADWNWWGTSAPTSSLFLAEGGAQIAWEEYLDYDPNGTCSDDGPLSMKGSRGTVTTSVTDTNDVIFRALRALHNRNRSTARGLLQSVIVSNPNSVQSVKAAAILSHMFRDSLDADIFGTMTRLWQQHRASHPVFGQAIAKMFQEQRRIIEAATMLNALATGNRNTVYEKRALLSLFSMYFTSPQHASLSGAVLQQLQARFADDPDVKHAAWIYGMATPSNSNLGRIAVEQQQATQPAEFKLEQNYPNPFNPTTTIRFAIPQNEHVTLKVHDLLGREVATLVDEPRKGGSYDETFDASRLSSGMYVYKLVAGSFTSSRKLLLVR